MYLSFMLNNILIILLLIEIYPKNYNICSYGNGDLEKFLGNDTNRNEKCFSLSYSFGNGECCISKTSLKCVDTNSIIESTEPQAPTLTTDLISENLDTTQSDDIITNKLLLRNVDEGENDLYCPEKNKLNITNNCGMAGIYMPQKNSTCNGISLVQGYCCFTRIKGNPELTACLRAKQLNKDKSKAPAEIEEYVKSKGGEIISVECGIFNLKLYWILNFIISIIYLF